LQGKQWIEYGKQISTNEGEWSKQAMSISGLSKARLLRLHDVMAGYVERGEVPGLVMLVSRRGEVHIDLIGTQAFGEISPMRRDTIFRISSMTKPIIAVATMILVEECKLRLDEPVDALLPELAERQVLKRLDGPLEETIPANRPITVRDLLTFRMGFGQIMGPPDAYPILKEALVQQIGMGPPSPSQMPAPGEWMRRLGQLPLMHQPGEQWMYNTGSDVLGVLIARASDQPLETFLRERIFEPLEMRDTGFSVPEASIDRLTTSYWTDPGSGKLTVYDKAAGGQWSREPSFPSGAGGLVSTIDDYLVFSQMMLSQGKHGKERILSRLSIETMTTDQLTPDQKAVSSLVPGFFDSHGWGFGVSVITRRDDIAAVPGRYGWDGLLGTSWYCDPREHMITVLMTPCFFASPNPPNVTFWTLAYQAIDD
jgi:CubicO group peptidase (beta-lactamase class C family)